MRLPPGVDQSSFDAALAKWREIVGPDWVLTSDEDVWTYRDAYTPFYGDESAEYIPSGAIAPTDVDQVQRIVAVANDHKLPIWPISTGRNLTYGGSAPRLSGTMMLDLKRMNRILEVNEPRAYALVEPGVTYFDFYKHLRTNDLKLWVDCADPGWGSLIGNALDHGVGHGNFRDHFGSICGLEVVLPNGDLLRTGSGSIPKSKQWQTFPYGYGPHVAPMFGQSNFGIVTKAGFFLMPEPQASRSDIVSVASHDAVHPFLDVMASLTSDFTLHSSWSIDSPVFNSRDAQVRAEIDRSDGEPTRALDDLARRKGLDYWTTRIYLHGDAAVIDAQYEHVKRRLASVPGITFRPGNRFNFPRDYDRVKDGDGGDIFAGTAVNIPSMSIYGLGIGGPGGPGGRRSNHGGAGFSPIIGMSGEELVRARRVFRRAYRDLGVPLSPEVGGWAWFRCNLVLLYGQQISDDAAENAKMRERVKVMIKIAADNGWSEYRTHPAFMDHVMEAQSFNGNALRRFHETIKDAVDPNGILSPGRSGIWPKSLRGGKHL